MSFFEEFEDMMPDTVTLHVQSGYNQAGDLQQAEDQEVQCYIEGGAQKVVDSDGVERVSKARVYLATTTEITPETLVTLPTGHSPRSRLPILDVMRMSDEDGISHMVLVL